MKGKFSALFSTPALIRRVLLSWLTSVSIAYCVIPRSLQNLQALDALQQMWLPAVLIMGVIFFSLLCILAYFWNMDQLERWFFLPVFNILAFFSLRSSFHQTAIFEKAYVIQRIYLYTQKKEPKAIRITHSNCFIVLSMFLEVFNQKYHASLQLLFDIISIIILYFMYNQTFEKKKYTAIITTTPVTSFHLVL